MNTAKLTIHDFATGDPLLLLRDPFNKEIDQILYVHDYLLDLSASSVLEESSYFDRDYLSEFTAFYATSTRGYANVCRRLHYFSGPRLTREKLARALGGSKKTIASLQSSYLGFVVVRPLSASPLGRTVLRWYEDPQPLTPRIVEPARNYEVHVAGLTLNVRGLAWQQQDSAVGACATVALWSMMHSSAFDDHHAIPTTAEITRMAHRTASLGDRVFPSRGLRTEQVLEVIKESRLAPATVVGTLPTTAGGSSATAFVREHFSSSCASLIRSGYPVLLIGHLEHGARVEGWHAACAVGFREAPAQLAAANGIRFQDSEIKYIYLHDDNIGPNARFEVADGQGGQPTRLVRSPPSSPYASSSGPSSQLSYPDFIPHMLIVAVHESIQVSPEELNQRGLDAADRLLWFLGGTIHEVTLATRFVRLPVYLGTMLETYLKLNSVAPLLARTRLALCEQVPPMSFHVGLVRLGHGDRLLMDILYDTTDSEPNMRPHCHVVYQPGLAQVTEAMRLSGVFDFGPCVDAS